MFDRELFKKRLCLARKRQNQSQQQLAESLRYERSIISKYESNNAIIPPVETIFNIAEALHVSVGYLLGLTDEYN